ncbi:hypothetical protein Tco_0387222 [Tanacetum coccineum]
MDDPNISMEEYIRLEEEKAQKRRKVFNWETVKYVYPDDLNSDKGDDDNEIDMIQSSGDMTPLPLRDQRYLWLHYQVVGYTEEIVHNFEQRLKSIFGRQVNRVYILGFEGLTLDMRIGSEMGLDVVDTLCFQLGGARCSMTGRQFILALGLHTAEEMADDGFRAYLLGSEKVIPNKGDLSDYWVEISSGRDFLRGAPSYTYIRDQVQRLCHRCAEGRKSDARLSGGHFIGRFAHHFGLVSDDGLRGLSVVARELPLIDMERQQVVAAGALEATEDAHAVDEGAQVDLAPIQAPQPPLPPPAAGKIMPPVLGRLEEEIQGLHRDVRSLRGLMERSMTDQG